jgi:nitrile hydratase
VSTAEADHLHDLAANVEAIESDLEYYRRKRLEPRILHLARRGVVPLTTLFRAASQVMPDGSPPEGGTATYPDLSASVAALQVRLDDFVRNVATVFAPLEGHHVAIEDIRRERGNYDPFFVIPKRSFEGSLEERVRKLHAGFDDTETVVRVFFEALVDSGRVTREQLQSRHRAFADAGYWNGARIVARAWVDPEFKERLLTQGRRAIRELDIPPGKVGILGIAENTAQVHNVVVCTLCSCYPSDLLGQPPWWYRSEDYREDVVADPRALLRDRFGLDVPSDVQVRVYDSTSDVRWMVLPARPEGTEHLTEDELARLITPESLVGTARALTPAEATLTSAPR